MHTASGYRRPQKTKEWNRLKLKLTSHVTSLLDKLSSIFHCLSVTSWISVWSPNATRYMSVSNLSRIFTSVLISYRYCTLSRLPFSLVSISYQCCDVPSFMTSTLITPISCKVCHVQHERVTLSQYCHTQPIVPSGWPCILITISDVSSSSFTVSTFAASISCKIFVYTCQIINLRKWVKLELERICFGFTTPWTTL